VGIKFQSIFRVKEQTCGLYETSLWPSLIEHTHFPCFLFLSQKVAKGDILLVSNSNLYLESKSKHVGSMRLVYGGAQIYSGHSGPERERERERERITISYGDFGWVIGLWVRI
jgi:hypothetical protein